MPYRRIFSFTMVLLALLNTIDIVLVKRWNLALGVPDEVLVLGDCALSPMARRFYIMPLYILAAKVCPPGAEATVFAILTALGNFGSSMSAYSGSLVLQWFDVRDGSYDGLVSVLVIKCLSRLLPLLLIPVLVPRGAPCDESASGSEGGVEMGRKGYESVEEDSWHSGGSGSGCSSDSASSRRGRRVDEVELAM